MLNTVIDYNIFDHFTKNAPKSPLIGSSEEYKSWLSFWDFLKQGSNVIITSANEKNTDIRNSIFVNELTTGRNKTTISLDQNNFVRPYKCKFPVKQDKQTVFFLNEPDISAQDKYRKNNGFPFGFFDDYFQAWRQIDFDNENLTLHNRKTADEKSVFSWQRFSKYLLPFTDVIIRDDFLFKRKEDIQEILGAIVNSLEKKAVQKYNLLIITNRNHFDNSFNSNLEEVYNYLTKNIFKNSRANIGIVHSSREHDRFIFFNYLQVTFGKIPDKSTIPTMVTFYPYTKPKNYSLSREILQDIKSLVNNAIQNNATAGNIQNSLLEFDRTNS